MIRDVSNNPVMGLGRLPDANEQMSRLPDGSEQTAGLGAATIWSRAGGRRTFIRTSGSRRLGPSGMGRLPDSSEQTAGLGQSQADFALSAAKRKAAHHPACNCGCKPRRRKHTGKRPGWKPGPATAGTPGWNAAAPLMSRPVGRLPGVEHIAGGLGRMGAMGAAPSFASTARPFSLNAGSGSRVNAMGTKKALPPGTDIMRGIKQKAAEALAAAKRAMGLKKEAVADLKRNDRRKAGIKAVQAVQLQRKAVQAALSVKKTQSVLVREAQANILEKEAAKKQSQAEAMVGTTGESARTMTLRAEAGDLLSKAKQLRAEAAVVAQIPADAGAPSNEEIARRAAKFDVRTRRNEAISREDDALLLATLQGLGEDTADSSDVNSDENAAAAYGDDQIGAILAAAETRDIPKFVTALQGVGSLGGMWDSIKEAAAKAMAVTKNIIGAGDEVKSAIDTLQGKGPKPPPPPPPPPPVQAMVPPRNFGPVGERRLPPPKKGMSLGMKIGIGVGAAAVLGGGIWFATRKK